MFRLESSEERAFARWADKQGIISKKMKTSEAAGWPDRMILLAGKMFFIEFKRPGKNPTKYQSYIHDRIRKRGFKVFIAYSNEEAQGFTLNEIQTT